MTEALSTPSLPLIDIAGLRSSDPAARQAVARELRSACERCGFFYIHNHGIDAGLIARVRAEAEQFFALPSASKLAVDKALSACNRGYEPLRGQTLEAGSPPDLKEGFYIGIDLPEDHPSVLAGRFNQGPNQWPADLPDFRDTMNAYFAAAYELSALLMRGLALSLELPEDHFAPFVTDASATLRLLHYPPQPPQPAPGEKGCGAHTDFGAVTLLLQDDAGGLQVQAIDSDEWIDAPPVEGTYVVNLGDLIARWTNDRYHSNLHRVINRSGRERYSVPFFFTGNLDLQVECLPTCLAPGEAPKYLPVSVEQHLAECYRRTYG
ncbi:isopenicillin N synthase family dioxygenase [Stutzerimonas azotifigens]|uniref:isopenicillin N synthase family dioxygenase n=1 Tax=Stutzerimonas azotifigens TaxID=291995 RepID=UPI0003FB88F0|nr:2-oxoglutarate and iron-dependent oxygenase domain-containing protein [Stutzerimonas azotifigens]